MSNSNISKQFRQFAGLGKPGTSVEENTAAIVEKAETEAVPTPEPEPKAETSKPKKAPAKKAAAKKTTAKK